MRFPRRPLALFVLLVVPGAAPAQAPLEITGVRIGFKGYEPGKSYSKSGMWVPVHVDLLAGPDNIENARMMLETNDNEDTPTITTFPIQPFLSSRQARTLASYVLPGNMSSEVRVKVKTRDKTYEKVVSHLDISRNEPTTQLFLTLGAKLDDVHRSLQQIRIQELAAAGTKANDELQQEVKKKVDGLEFGETSPRFLAVETDAKALPDKYQGYQAVDLMILSTEKAEFIRALRDDEPRLRALAQWVSRGGHLVISVHWKNQNDVAGFLAQAAWQPPVPVKLPPGTGKPMELRRLTSVEQWAQVNNKVFQSSNEKVKIPFADLRPPSNSLADWDVQAAELVEVDADVLPTIVRTPYGLGSITFLAFSIDQGSHLSKWEGRFEFWKRLIRRLTPRLPQSDNGQQFNAQIRDAGQDLITRLHGSLDTWDVAIVPFGLVALFILIYIVIVGPLDYLLLKHVFKRLEWTWITFPLVVCAVSLAAYYTASAIKGSELRINQVDIVDIDMRTELNDKRQPARAFIYGQTFFALFSPRLQSYTIGLEPNPRFWGQNLKTPLSADMVSWMGKGGNVWGGPENRGSQMYFRRPYQINDPADQSIGLVGVPIPIWASKSFTGTWGAALPTLPLLVDLVYHRESNESDTIVSGELGNNLPVDLEDVWLCYNDMIYSVTDLLPAGKTRPLQVNLPLPQKQKTRKAYSWVLVEDVCDSLAPAKSENGEPFNPTAIIKEAFVFDKSAAANNGYNQWLRRLDGSWRLKEEVKRERDTRLRDAILYARVRLRSGPAEELCADEKNPLPTRVWLGDLPGHAKVSGTAPARPAVSGILNQDTYVRILIPIRPSRQ